MLRYTYVAPEEFAERYPYRLDTRHPCTADSTISDTFWYQIEKLEKEQCTGGIVTVRYTDNEITVNTAAGETKSCDVEPRRSVWLVLELYGVSVKVETNMSNPPSELSEPVQCTDNGGDVENENLREFRSSRIPDPVNLKKPIQQNFVKIKQNLKLQELVDHLYAAEMLTTDELTHLFEVDSAKASNHLLLKILSTRPVSKKALIKALQETLQEHLITFFFPEMVKE